MKLLVPVVAFFFTILQFIPMACAQDIDSGVIYYKGAPAPLIKIRQWNMNRGEKAGRAGPDGEHLWFNTDWKAKPWAGVIFSMSSSDNTSPPLKLDENWLAHGFLRFIINSRPNRYGFYGQTIRIQIRPEVKGVPYRRLRPIHIDSGRGVDEDEISWQEVLVPLGYWNELSAGQEITGIDIQFTGQLFQPVGIDEVGLARFNENAKSQFMTTKKTENIVQTEVTWPPYEDLPSPLQAVKHPPEVVNGKFSGPDRKRVFLLAPYVAEDPRTDLYGSTNPLRLPPSYGLYDKKKHGWIYEKIPTGENLSRLGFNFYSAFMPPAPWLTFTGFRGVYQTLVSDTLPWFYRKIRLPFHVDMVNFPWTLGLADTPDKTNLSADHFTTGRHHWMPYNISGEGRKTWLSMWQLYARRYRDANVPVLTFELMNEPAYMGVSPEDLRGFVPWLKQRYRTLDEVNQTWDTSFRKWDAIISFHSGTPDEIEKELKSVRGRWFDYDEYLSELLTSLISEGVEELDKLLPGTLVGLQPMNGYVQYPRDAIWKHRIIKHETVVLMPTGGGQWTEGSEPNAPPDSILKAPVAPAPLEHDLILTMAGTKMIFDNEIYLKGQTSLEVRNSLWKEVIAGLDGLTVFSWSRRGWAWWKGIDKVQDEAVRYPYANLIPAARKTEALYGIYKFASEIQPLAELILPKPWKPEPSIALLYDWAQARHTAAEHNEADKTPFYYASLKYSHWNFELLPSDKALLGGSPKKYDVIVAGGLSHVEKSMPKQLKSFVESGGILIVGEESMKLDLYEHYLHTEQWLGIKTRGWLENRSRQVSIATEENVPIPGTISGIKRVRNIEKGENSTVLIRDNTKTPIVTRQQVGNGWVYFQAADLSGYSLAKILWYILKDASVRKGRSDISYRWRLAEIRDPKTHELVPNILLSRRSYPGRHVLMIMNRNRYPKSLNIDIRGIKGRWSWKNALTDRKFKNGQKISLKLDANEPAVIILRKR